MMFGRQMFMFEAPEDGGGEPAAWSPGPTAANEPAADWSPTPEWGQRIDQFIEGAGPVLQNLNQILSAPDDQYQQDVSPEYLQWQQDYANWQAQYGDQFGYDQQQQQQFDPSVITQAVQEAMGPFTPMLQQMAEQQGEQYANQVLSELESKVGSFDRNQAITVAQGLLAQGYGAEEALSQAASIVHEYEAQVRQAGVDEYRKTLERQAGATGDIGAGGSAMETPGVPRGGNRYEEVIQRMVSGMNAS